MTEKYDVIQNHIPRRERIISRPQSQPLQFSARNSASSKYWKNPSRTSGRNGLIHRYYTISSVFRSALVPTDPRAQRTVIQIIVFADVSLIPLRRSRRQPRRAGVTSTKLSVI
ncbi:hypothetical protein EVAR_3905_1 [Eumeta japonica]|uniref:Uncharacterized protein n=1 Tax=Eumeta variegata TaxID=151549 RepID=A0A4C1SQY0_EUMVA|nr:hypothetical protein EVAR_3905_1 [Eumeta japonica]